jgi:hypothetical protein
LGPAEGRIEPAGASAAPAGTAQKNGIASRDRKSPVGCVSRIVSTFRSAEIPAMDSAAPAM